jgi:hypothetical protein
LVALATIGEIPNPISAGKVSSVPPPAMALMTPATAEIATMTTRRGVSGETADTIVRDSTFNTGKTEDGIQRREEANLS